MTSAITINQLLDATPSASSQAAFLAGPEELSLDDLASVFGGSLSYGETVTAVLAGAGVVVAAGAALMAAPAVVGGAAAMGGAYLVAAGAGTAIGTVISVFTH